MDYQGPSPFARKQRDRQSEWKQTWPGLPDAARASGVWQDVPCSFILPVALAEFNLWEPMRQEVLEYFQGHKIAWHQGDTQVYGPREKPGPSPHLLASQVCALNFWWGLGRSPSGMRAALRAVFGDVEAVVPPGEGGPLVEAEWVGLADHLGERGWPSRGQYATSADILLAYVDASGRRRGVLLESKYTESYAPSKWLHTGPSGRVRLATYGPHFERADGPIRSDADIRLKDLLIEPIYQHLRQQLLAAAMERAHELEFETVTCLHVAPRANIELHTRITAPKLEGRGATAGDAWRSILRQPDRYRSVAYEDLFQAIAGLGDPAIEDWVRYQQARYGWNR